MAITLWIKWLPSNADHFCTIKTGHCWLQIDYRQRGTEREQGSTSQKSIHEMKLCLLCKNLYQTSILPFSFYMVVKCGLLHQGQNIDWWSYKRWYWGRYLEWEEENGDCKNPHMEKPYKLYFSPNVSSAIKSKRTMCQGYAAQNGEKWNDCKVSVRKPVGKNDHLQDEGIKRKRILKQIIKRKKVGRGGLY
jgi:hypothetical protein